MWIATFRIHFNCFKNGLIHFHSPSNTSLNWHIFSLGIPFGLCTVPGRPAILCQEHKVRGKEGQRRKEMERGRKKEGRRKEGRKGGQRRKEERGTEEGGREDRKRREGDSYYELHSFTRWTSAIRHQQLK